MPQSISAQVAQTDVDPAVLVSHVHKANHAKSNLLVGHVTQIMHDRSILLPPEARLGKDLVERDSANQAARSFGIFNTVVTELLP